MQVLDKGEMTISRAAGEDIDIVQAARISNGAAMPEWRGVPDEKLIQYLAKHGHTSPFEQAWFKFYVKLPIFVVREWMRHRTLSYNERSARYSMLPREFWEPWEYEEIRIPDPNNKQSSVEIEDHELTLFAAGKIDEAYTVSWDSYESMIEAGIAREVARTVLPVGIYTEMIVSGNFLNWYKFYRLRSTQDAQREIRSYANALDGFMTDAMPLSWAALKENIG